MSTPVHVSLLAHAPQIPQPEGMISEPALIRLRSIVIHMLYEECAERYSLVAQRAFDAKAARHEDYDQIRTEMEAYWSAYHRYVQFLREAVGGDYREIRISLSVLYSQLAERDAHDVRILWLFNSCDALLLQSEEKAQYQLERNTFPETA